MLSSVRRWHYLGFFARSAIPTILINFVVQKILRVSGRFRYLLHFTSCTSAAVGIELYGDGINAERCLALNGGILVQGANGVKIHRSVLIAPGAKIISGNHDFFDFRRPATHSKPILIMECCWIGANAVILPGVELLPGTIVGAGSVVVKSFNEPNITVCGNPARIVKRRELLEPRFA